MDINSIPFWLMLGFLFGWIVEFIFDSIWVKRIERRYEQEMHDLGVELEQNESAVRGMRERIDGLERQLNSESIRNEKMARQIEESERARAELAETKARHLHTEADLHRVNIQAENLNSLLSAAQSSASKSDEALTELRMQTELKERNLSISQTRIQVLEEQLQEVSADLEAMRAASQQKDVDLRTLNAHAQEADSLRRLLKARERELEALRREKSFASASNNNIDSVLDSGLAATNHSIHTNNNHSNANNEQSTIITALRDDFVQLKGVGNKYANALYQSGITTFDQLAQQSPERVNEIINPQFWQVIDPASWIAEAAVMAQRQQKD